MLAAIQAFANQVPITQVDPNLVLSKALTLYDGVVDNGGTRVETGLIAKFEFKTGTGTVAYDTSGVEPALNLDMTGDVTWVGGWGVQVANKGKLQGTTTGSAKLHDMILTTGEYSVEAWVAPANVTQTNAYIVSYSPVVGSCRTAWRWPWSCPGPWTRVRRPTPQPPTQL